MINNKVLISVKNKVVEAKRSGNLKKCGKVSYNQKNSTNSLYLLHLLLKVSFREKTLKADNQSEILSKGSRIPEMGEGEFQLKKNIFKRQTVLETAWDFPEPVPRKDLEGKGYWKSQASIQSFPSHNSPSPK